MCFHLELVKITFFSKHQAANGMPYTFNKKQNNKMLSFCLFNMTKQYGFMSILSFHTFILQYIEKSIVRSTNTFRFNNIHHNKFILSSLSQYQLLYLLSFYRLSYQRCSIHMSYSLSNNFSTNNLLQFQCYFSQAQMNHIDSIEMREYNKIYIQNN